MKSFKSTWVFALVVLALAALTYQQFESGEAEKAGELKSSQAFPDLTVDKIAGAELVRPGEHIILQVEGRNWELKKPIDDLADAAVVNSWLTRILNEKIKEVPITGEPKWSRYGLASPTTWLVLKDKAGVSFKLYVSEQELYDGSFYVRRGSENKLLMGASLWREIVGKEANALRSKKLFPQGQEVRSVTMRPRKGDEVTLFLDNKSAWRIKGHEEWPLSASAVEAYLDTLKTSLAVDFTFEQPDKADLKRYGLAKPFAEVLVEFKDAYYGEEKTWHFIWSELKDKVHYAKTNVKPTVYKYRASTLEKWLPKVSDLRDKRAPFKFDRNLVQELNIRIKDNSLKVLRDGGSWKLEGEKAELALDKVTELFDELDALEVTSFLGAKKGELDKNQLTLKAHDGKVVFDLKWSSKTKKISADEKEKFFLARTNLSRELLAVDLNKIGSIEAKDFLMKSDPAKDKK